MALSISAEPVPLATDADGVLRVGQTRVTLDTVVTAFLGGATAEEIAYQYPSLQLADVYAVIAFYLRRREEVEEYLRSRQQESELIRRQNEDKFDPSGVRDRLLSRQAE